MGQISVEIMPLPGSVLRGNQHLCAIAATLCPKPMGNIIPGYHQESATISDARLADLVAEAMPRLNKIDRQQIVLQVDDCLQFCCHVRRGYGVELARECAAGHEFEPIAGRKTLFSRKIEY